MRTAAKTLGLLKVLLGGLEDHLLGNVVAGTALEPGCGLPLAVLHGLDGSHEVGRGVIPEPDLLDHVLREQLGHVLTKYSSRRQS